MKSRIVGLGLAFLLINCGYSFAQEPVETTLTKTATHEENTEKTVQKYCLVCGPESEMEGLAVSYKYKGTKYSFCSMDCLKAFKKDPEPYLKATESAKKDADHYGDK